MKEISPGSKFDFRESWGEQYTSLYDPSIFIVDIERNIIKEVDGLPEKVSCGQVIWTPDSTGLVFTGWDTSERRLGFIYCYNRPSSIYYIPISFEDLHSDSKESDKSTNECKFIKLTTGRYCTSPIFSPSGDKLIYLSPDDNTKTHFGCTRLCQINWSDKRNEVIIDIVKLPSSDSFPGLYLHRLHPNTFITENDIVVQSVFYSEIGIVLKRGSTLLDIGFGRVLLKSGVSNQIPFLEYSITEDIDTNEPNRFAKWIRIAEKNEHALTSRISELVQRIVRVAVKGTPFHFEYFIISPKSSEPLPLILYPHGGPHSIYATNFEPSRIFLALAGYHLLFVNFRGSIGFGEDFKDSLPGHVGDYDIEDCKNALTDALQKYPNEIDSSRIVYFGGSHGGFIGGHLIAREERLKAAVLYNPVTNLVAMHYISDIPDWCMVEAGIEDLSPDSIVKMWKSSPVYYVDSVVTPTLVILGDNDQRVPMSNGKNFYFQLKKKGVPTRLLIYPGEPHNIAKVEHLCDLWLNIVDWFNTHLKGK